MRLWSLHPKYLDRRGLVALWREGLLAQAVLRGRTRGYTRHPQLARFRETGAPVAALASYLRAVHDEAVRRGYAFDLRKLARSSAVVRPLTVTRGQLAFEWEHLRAKVARRDPEWLRALPATAPQAHPLFRIVAGGVEAWERGVPSGRTTPTG
jgi:hypothetical protein